MPEVTINNVIVNFPFKPYSVQEEYMTKVIECLQNNKNGVLESPTGTGKTLCLLCSSLSWLLTKKAQLQAQSLVGGVENPTFGGHFFKKLKNELNEATGNSNPATSFSWTAPKIIYASRTHSQLSQAMQELKRTSYKHVTVAVLGSRDQLCIHPEVSKEINALNKIYMCQSKVKSRTCFYYNNVETRKDDPSFKQEVLDIEDLVKAGHKNKCCPYFLSKELKQNADIIFMPYNYLLDPKSRRSQGIDLQNSVVLLDEAHNIEKICEEAASLQICSTDIAMCIDELTVVMEYMAKDIEQNEFSMETSGNVQIDFTAEDLYILKTMFLDLEKAIDSIQIVKREEGDTHPGGYIFELLEKAQLTHGKEQVVIENLEKIVLYLTTTSTSPFTRKGNALQKFSDVLRTVFNHGNSLRYKEKIKQCYKVHIQVEEQKKSKKDVWGTKKKVSKNEGKVISYWCFSPGYSMQQLMEQGVQSVVLTSGTLSPLKPFISELGIPIEVQLENPHIVKGEQICVGVLSQGPDGYSLNSSFNTRNDPKYIMSLGRTIFNFSCLIPHGLLIFFPSYPVMKKCREEWQNVGLWTKIAERKPIYVEPQYKDDFLKIINEYYERIKDPSHKGAIFMAVCRGKVSEGLDFANANGRAVMITGLPFPPLKDPRVILKQRYLEEIKRQDNDILSGQQWYQLEASRAVNQAIGRIIRHKNDYGAIILCDCRFENPSFKKQLSAWLRPYVKNFNHFGFVTKELRDFFRYANCTLPQPRNVSLPATSASFNTTVSQMSKNTSKPKTDTKSSVEDNFNIDLYIDKNEKDKKPAEAKKKSFFEILATDSKPMINFSTCKLEENQTSCELTKNITESVRKKRKIIMLPVECNEYLSGPSTLSDANIENVNAPTNSQQSNAETDNNSTDKKVLGKIYIKEVKQSLSQSNYKIFSKIIQDYNSTNNFEELLKVLKNLFPPNKGLDHLFIGFKHFLKKQHIAAFEVQVAHLRDMQ
ncbi:regulator of telomere elongation helicase 1 homolog isoform X1 [Osmia bicornis bicornis]|uniref:regulator of telomere elongation helicase 1 homolog isoform X1 n=2 Tax=Osmia bicornis bicornis TaxID=1437191 RepID=UPI001EAEBF17|nr:regulator of telomere elongation helicase 1 homolog isoform X1 [Osmia bicornis bicornis]